MNTVLPSIIKNYLDIDKNPIPEDTLTQTKNQVLGTYVESETGYLKSSYADYVFDQMQIVSGWLYGLEEQSDINASKISNIEKNIGKVGENPIVESIDKIQNDISSIKADMPMQTREIMDTVAKDYVTNYNLETRLLDYVKRSEFQDILTIRNTLKEKYYDKYVVNEEIRKLNNKISDLELKHTRDIEEIRDSSNSSNNQIYSYVNNQIKSITSTISNTYAHKNQIDSIRTSLNNTMSIRLNNYVLNTELDRRLEAIGKNFVQIVSQKQYNTLKTYNKLLPDNIYLITKFNRPQALYIGKFLIAIKDPNADDNTCFPYTFPIVF
jgi:hypothetical protein